MLCQQIHNAVGADFLDFYNLARRTCRPDLYRDVHAQMAPPRFHCDGGENPILAIAIFAIAENHEFAISFFGMHATFPITGWCLAYSDHAR
jgi:hypothetical protein